MEINYTVSNTTVNVKLTGELDTPASVKIQPVIDEIIGLNPKDINVDCSELSYIASSGLRQFLMMRKKSLSNGGVMNLRGVVPSVRNVFAITNFDKIFNM